MAILKSFYRPHTIAETVALLNQPNVHLVPLAGGAKLVGRLEASGLTAIDGVIDLRRLGLDYIRTDRDDLCIGATVTLTALANHELAGALVDGLLRRAAYGEGPLNLRNVATVGGIVATAEYDSELYAALLALDATATIHTAGAQGKSVETTIPLTHLDKIAGLLTEIRIPWQEGRGGHARVGAHAIGSPHRGRLGRFLRRWRTSRPLRRGGQTDLGSCILKPAGQLQRQRAIPAGNGRGR